MIAALASAPAWRSSVASRPVDPRDGDVTLSRVHSPASEVHPTDTASPTRTTYWREEVFHPAWKAAGLARLLPHDLRHTTATQLYDHDYKIEEIAKVLGDTVNTVEATYVHIFALRGRGDRMKAYDQRVAAALLDKTHAPPKVIEMTGRRRAK